MNVLSSTLKNSAELTFTIYIIHKRPVQVVDVCHSQEASQLSLDSHKKISKCKNVSHPLLENWK